MYKIGIIGKGFVGSAVAHGFSESVGYKAEIRIHDKDPSKSQNSSRKLFENLISFLYLSQLHQKAMDLSV